MFKFYQNILCVHGGWLYNEGAIMTKTNYDNLVSRKILNKKRKGGNGRKALVSYMSIPERFKKLIIAKVGDPLGMFFKLCLVYS